MSEDEARRNMDEEQDEVEAHKRALGAQDEGDSDDDDVEAHRHVKGKHVKG